MPTLLHLPGFDPCPRAWIESRAPPRLQCSLFCICWDSIHVQVHGSNPGPPQCSFASARIRSRSRNLDRIPAPPDFSAQDSPGFDRGPGTWIKSSDQTQRGRCHPIKQFYKVTPHFRQKRNYFFPALIRHYEAANMFISFVYHIFYKSKHQQKIILTFLIWHIL